MSSHGDGTEHALEVNPAKLGLEQPGSDGRGQLNLVTSEYDRWLGMVAHSERATDVIPAATEEDAGDDQSDQPEVAEIITVATEDLENLIRAEGKQRKSQATRALGALTRAHTDHLYKQQHGYANVDETLLALRAGNAFDARVLARLMDELALKPDSHYIPGFGDESRLLVSDLFKRWIMQRQSLEQNDQ